MKNENMFNSSKNVIDSINTLWVEKYRPTKLNELAAAKELKLFLHKCIKEQNIPNVLLHGKAGCGKNSIVSIIRNSINAAYLVINASEERGIDTIRDKVMQFALSAAWDVPLKIVVMNEADGLMSTAQDSLRELIETSSANCRFIFTCNYVSRIIDPIISRCTEFELSPEPKEIASRLYQIYSAENIKFDDTFIPLIIKKYGVDIRKMINESQKIYASFGELSSIALQNTHSNIYFDFFDRILSETSVKKISDITKKMLFNDDIYSAFKDYMVEKYDNAEAVVIIGDWAWKSRSMADRDLAFLCCLFTIKDLFFKR